MRRRERLIHSAVVAAIFAASGYLLYRAVIREKIFRMSLFNSKNEY